MPKLHVSRAWVAGITATLLLAALGIYASQAGEPAPLSTAEAEPAIRDRIRAFEAGTARSGANVMSFVVLENRPVYLFISPCCDQFNRLYDAEGRFICAPTGGFAGSGDGNCPDWVRLRKARLPSSLGAQPSSSPGNA